MVLDAETVEGRLPTPLLGVGGATTKTQNKKKAKAGRSPIEEFSRHSPVALICLAHNYPGAFSSFPDHVFLQKSALLVVELPVAFRLDFMNGANGFIR